MIFHCEDHIKRGRTYSTLFQGHDNPSDGSFITDSHSGSKLKTLNGRMLLQAIQLHKGSAFRFLLYKVIPNRLCSPKTAKVHIV